MGSKKFDMKKRHPVENQNTAAWANIERVEGEGKVPIPSEFNTELAKQWVEENEK